MAEASRRADDGRATTAVNPFQGSRSNSADRAVTRDVLT